MRRSPLFLQAVLPVTLTLALRFHFLTTRFIFFEFCIPALLSPIQDARSILVYKRPTPR